MNEKALACVKLIEEALCCPICKEPFKIPVIIVSCSHNFCSICIRRYFAIKQECPICGIDASQGSLSPNRIIDGLVQRFNELRDLLEQEQTNDNNGSTKPETSQPLFCQLPTFSDLSTGSHMSLPTEQQPCEVSTINTDAGNKSPKTCVAGAASCSKKSPVMFLDSEVVENTPEFSLGLQEFCTQSQGLSLEPCNVSGTSTEMFHSEVATKSNGESTSSITCAQQSLKCENPPVVISNTSKADKDVKADCPVCGLPVLCPKMNAHLDNCLAREEKKKALRQNTPKRQKINKPAITKIAYNLISLKELKKKMKEIGLSTSGNKEELVRRHKEFLVKFFAEQDKVKPRRLTIVLQELEREEMEKKFQTTRATRNAKKRILLGHDNSNCGNGLDKKEHLKRHAKQYKELEEIVKKSLPQKRTKDKGKKTCLNHGSRLPSEGETSESLDLCSGVLHLSNDVKASSDISDPGSPELYVGATPSKCDTEVAQNHQSGNLNAVLQADSQGEEIKNFIDASLI
uniref:RING-type E3 ubiquitin transferase n=1 Tax=Phallusia mammillata TaxID=59560 RepID=A0A6F9DQE0_9ASCI|nr:postreplication repair E3 ubiquitin-protein ligase rad18-like [Phallusia mammillata]